MTGDNTFVNIIFSRAYSNEAAVCLLTRPYLPVAEFQKEKLLLELTVTLGLREIYIHQNNDEAKGQSGKRNWKKNFLMTKS
jgi:hypothetical protein